MSFLKYPAMVKLVLSGSLRSMRFKRKRSNSSQEEPRQSKLPRACWNDFTTKTLLEVMIEEINAGNRVNGNINSNGWRNIVHKFHVRTGRPYTKVQLRNRSSLIRKLYGKWRKLNDRATGLGVDPRTGAIQAADEWWDEMPQILKWKSAPPKFLDLMTECFAGNVATGADTYYPYYCRGGGTFRPPPRPAPPVMPVCQVPYMSWGNAEVVASNFCPAGASSPSCSDSSRYKRTQSGTSKPSIGERMATCMEDYVGEKKKQNALLQSIISGFDDLKEVDLAMSLVHKIEGINRNSTLYVEIMKILRIRLNRHHFLKYVCELDQEWQIEWFKSFM